MQYLLHIMQRLFANHTFDALSAGRVKVDGSVSLITSISFK